MSNRRYLSLAVGTSLTLGAFSAQAVTIDGVNIGSEVASFTWTSDTAAYQAYAQNCGAAGCATNGIGNPTGQTFSPDGSILFFWGTAGTSTNSTETWTYTPGWSWAQPLNLTHVAITSTGQSGTQGTEYTADGLTALGTRLTGTGLTGTWPVDNGTGQAQGNPGADATPISNARITILANGASVGVNGAVIETSRPSGVLADSPFQVDANSAQSAPADPTTPWIMRAAGALDGGSPDVVAYVQMPVSQSFAISGSSGKELAAGNAIELILHEQSVSNQFTDGSGATVTGPSAMLASANVQMVGTYVAPTLGVNNAATLDLGLFRIGDANTDAQAQNATATNTKVSQTQTTKLYDVTFGNASDDANGDFVRVGSDPATVASVSEGAANSVSRGYTYHATDFGLNTGTVAISAITGVNADGSAYTGTTANTSANVTFTATGVGPRFQLTGQGLDNASDTSVDFGSVLITKGSPTAQIQKTLTVTNTYTGAGQTNTTLTGLTVKSNSIDGSNPSNFAAATDNTPIAANGGTQSVVATFSASTAGTKTATLHFNTDVGTTLGGVGGAIYDRTLTASAYVATLSADSTPINLGYARVGGAAAGPQAVSVQNQTGGGYALTGVSFGSASGAASGFAFSGGGNYPGSLADGATATSNYSASALATLGPSTTVRNTTATATISSTEAPDTTRTLSVDAVGPVFNFSGSNVGFNYTDTGGSCNTVGASGNQVCGTINLGLLDPAHTTTTLTLANLFNASGLNLAALGNIADLTLINVGFGPGYTQNVAFGTGLFSLGSLLAGTQLDPTNGGLNSAVNTSIQFTSSAAGTNFIATLHLLTDVNTALGATSGGKEFLFDIVAAWQGNPTPIPGAWTLVALGLAGVRLSARRRS